jgi:2,4-dienoyl-CoA reductase-like NADH-dependent reductase (Old Yellow Enzyme family)
VTQNPALFQSVTFRSVTARNRIAVSPMCQYSARDGLGDDWHIQNLGAKAAGGAGIVFTEATHVSDIGRITRGCLGLWTDAHQAFLTRLAGLIAACGAVPGIQLAHAGRKASCEVPWKGGAPIAIDAGGWQPLGPSALPFSDASTVPVELSPAEITGIVAQFAASASRALEAGFKILELHAAHGYLIHSFLSPVSNRRGDRYGGDIAGRMRVLMEIIDEVRAVWPWELPLFVRLSCADYVDAGLTSTTPWKFRAGWPGAATWT